MTKAGYEGVARAHVVEDCQAPKNGCRGGLVTINEGCISIFKKSGMDMRTLRYRSKNVN